MKDRHFPIHAQSWLAIALITIGVLLGALSVGMLLRDRYLGPQPPPQALTSRATPSSVKPTTQVITSYRVPAADPKYITIPRIDVANSRIIKLGLTKGNQIAVPNNIYDTGWYNRSAEPGQKGAMFIYGHVSSWTANGVFYNLKKLKAGDILTVTRGDNKAYNYRVVSSVIYPYNHVDMNKTLAPVDPQKPGLNLMTCTGQTIKGTGEFNERLVVFTSLQM